MFCTDMFQYSVHNSNTQGVTLLIGAITLESYLSISVQFEHMQIPYDLAILFPGVHSK